MSKYMSNRKPSSEITLDVSGMGDCYLLSIYEAARDFADGDGGTNDRALDAIGDWLLYEGPWLIKDMEAEAAAEGNPEYRQQMLDGANKMRSALAEIEAMRSNPIADAVSDYFSNPANEAERDILEANAGNIREDGRVNLFASGQFSAVANLAALKIAPEAPGAEIYEVKEAIYKYFGEAY